MTQVLGKKRLPVASDFILGFVQSWDMRGTDETTICAGTVDVLRAYLGERPCCVWLKNGPGLSKVSERGMVDLFFGEEKELRQAALNRAVVSGAPEFDALPMSSQA